MVASLGTLSSFWPTRTPAIEGREPRSGLNWLAAITERDSAIPQGRKNARNKSGMVRNTLWPHADEAEGRRERASNDRRTESSIMREALRRLLGIED